MVRPLLLLLLCLSALAADSLQPVIWLRLASTNAAQLSSQASDIDKEVKKLAKHSSDASAQNVTNALAPGCRFWMLVGVDTNDTKRVFKLLTQTNSYPPGMTIEGTFHLCPRSEWGQPWGPCETWPAAQFEKMKK